MAKHERKDKDVRKPSSDKQKKDQKGGGNQQNAQNQQLSKEDIPESTNESTGAMGSGQRQDSN